MILFWVKRMVLLALMLFLGFWALFGILLIFASLEIWNEGGPIVLGMGAVILALSGVLLKKSWDAWKILSLARPQADQAAADKPAGEIGETAAPEAAGEDGQAPAQQPAAIKKELTPETKYRIKIGVSLACLAAGLAMMTSSDEGVNALGVTLFIAAVIAAAGFGFSHNHKIAQEEKRRAKAALQACMASVEAMTQLPVITQPVAVVMRPGEVCHYQTAASVLQVKNEVVGHTSGYRGMSIHVAKGLTLHTGGSRGHAIRADVAHTYPGTFTITSRRVIMTGAKGFDHPISKLTALSLYGDNEGIVIQFGRSTVSILMDAPYWVTKIVSLMRQQKEPQASGASFRLERSREPAQPERLEELPQPEPPREPPQLEEEVQSPQDPDQVPTPEGAELSYAEVQALDFWNGKKTSFEVPQYYMRTPFGQNVKEALPRLLDGGYLEQGDLEQRVSLKKVPELKAILSEHQLKVSGTKKELVQRILDHFDPEDLEKMFPENVYHISEKGRQAMEPYSILRDNDAHALGLSYYRLMQAKEAQPDEENNVILTQLLSEDIQKCYQEQNRAAFQRVIGTTGRFMREVGEYGLSFECYALAFFVWVNDPSDHLFATDSQLYYMAKNVEQAGKLCGYSFDQLCEAFEKAVQKSNPFALDTEENRSEALSRLKEALGL